MNTSRVSRREFWLRLASVEAGPSAMTKFSTVPNAAPARLTREEGATFSLFDGHIAGRNVEIVPNRGIVQALRDAEWEEGLYSVARFELAGQQKTTLTFDHTGFPKGRTSSRVGTRTTGHR